MDSWENQANSDVSSQLTALNINAPVFVPGQNIHAAEFVPGGGLRLANEDVKAVPAGDAVSQEDPPDWESAANNDNTLNDGPTDLTAATASSSAAASGVATPAEEEFDEEQEDGEAPGDVQKTAAKPKTKKKQVKEVIIENRKEPVNIVFCGHVDAGKSTIGGQLLFLTGMVDKRTLEKYEKEAKEKNRETWYLSWALDTNLEEREKGKTVECGRAHFETENKHFTLLDAPGHRSFVPNMIGGAAQADVAILVISARRGEFETGFVKDGQTREHAMLVKTAGVKHLVVLINKMDDPTVEWSEERYRECCDKLLPYLKKCGFNPKSDIHFMPCSGYTGAWLRDPPPNPEKLSPYYSGPPLLTYLDTLPPLNRSSDGPLRLPIAERYKDMGVFVMGKLESGSLRRGEQLALMPNRVSVEALQIFQEDQEVESAVAGENVKVKLKNIDEDEISQGFVLCSPLSLCKVGDRFDAQIIVLAHKSIICAGYTAVMHLHTSYEEVTLRGLLCTLDKRTGKKKDIKPRFIKQDSVAIARFKVDGGNVCVESFSDFPQMGRFTLRDEGKTVAIGKILKVFDPVVSNNQAD